MTDINPIMFIFNCMRSVATLLQSYSFWNVSLWMWSVGFIVLYIIIGVFWKGARG